jgi:hypothetical protein
MPYPSTVYATRYVYLGYKNAFTDLGYKFVTYSPGQNLKNFLETNQPDLFITSSHFFYRKFLDYKLLETYRTKKGMVLLTKIDFWKSPLNRNRVNESPSMMEDTVVKKLIKAGLLGDYYFHSTAQGDKRMDGFKQFAQKDYITIPLAADKIALKPLFAEKFAADISFIGTNLPQKRQYFKEWLFPLRTNYQLKLYGQDWTSLDRLTGLITKSGQYFNMPVIKNLQKPVLQPGEEAKIYASSRILVNIHEDYQRAFGGDCNERTFKIPFCGGLEISDNVRVIHEYFKEDKEIVIAHSKTDWFDKIRHYLDHPKQAQEIAKAGQVKASEEHTYHNRAKQMLDLIN